MINIRLMPAVYIKPETLQPTSGQRDCEGAVHVGEGQEKRATEVSVVTR